MNKTLSIQNALISFCIWDVKGKIKLPLFLDFFFTFWVLKISEGKKKKILIRVVRWRWQQFTRSTSISLQRCSGNLVHVRSHKSANSKQVCFCQNLVILVWNLKFRVHFLIWFLQCCWLVYRSEEMEPGKAFDSIFVHWWHSVKLMLVGFDLDSKFWTLSFYFLPFYWTHVIKRLLLLIMSDPFGRRGRKFFWAPSDW